MNMVVKRCVSDPVVYVYKFDGKACSMLRQGKSLTQFCDLCGDVKLPVSGVHRIPSRAFRSFTYSKTPVKR